MRLKYLVFALTLQLPHPHEINQQIASFPNAYFSDLITTQLNDNVIILGHRWLDLHMLEGIVDLGLIYNGTTSIELGILGGVDCAPRGFEEISRESFELIIKEGQLEPGAIIH